MSNSEAWINARYLGKRQFGYVGFEYDISAVTNYDGVNVMAVKISPEDSTSR